MKNHMVPPYFTIKGESQEPDLDSRVQEQDLESRVKISDQGGKPSTWRLVVA